jgi:hypothetical protein
MPLCISSAIVFLVEATVGEDLSADMKAHGEVD